MKKYSMRTVSGIRMESRSHIMCFLCGMFRSLKAVIPFALLSTPVSASTVSFTNIAENPAMNLSFERNRSESYSVLLDLYKDSLVTPFELGEVFTRAPHRTGGFPGVALLDHDGDGDLDIYVTNGPGAANGLFSNQIVETGYLGFMDLSATSGADAFDLDSNGVCFGDLDNDGDDDLYVLGREAENRLYENIDGAFFEVFKHGAEAGTASHISCSMGDIDADGLLDIVVSNAFKLENALALVVVPYDLNQHNQLFHNEGGLSFSDVTTSSGILNMTLGGTTDPQPPTISWAVAMIDIDRDGDTDIVFADDQAALPNKASGGFDRGYVQLFLNDGTGRFTNAPIAINDFSAAAWMGLGFGDIDCDGSLDIFGSNLGDYMVAVIGGPAVLGNLATRWLLGNGNGNFTDPQVGYPTVFGWGNGVADLDNDGDQDLLYHGAMDLNAFVTHDNPGLVLENQDCGATFEQNLTAFRGDYTLRGTQGVATGDLDQDGYVDVVTVSNHTIDPAIPFFISPAQYGSELDATANFYRTMTADPATGLLSWGGIETFTGDMTVEINNGSGNRAVAFRTMGSVDITRHGRNNRSGIGAVVSFTPQYGNTTAVPIVGGSSFASQHALEAHFGMGGARLGTVEVQWQGGVRNRLYKVYAGERLVLPEIPCSIDGDVRLRKYARCVGGALEDLIDTGTVSYRHALRLYVSAIIAFFDERRH